MSLASLQAYAAIIPELPAREAAVLGVLLAREAILPLGTDKNAASANYVRFGGGQEGCTNREIARALNLDRDSISPRTARLRQKGLVVEVGIRGKETTYAAVREPKFEKVPRNRRAKAYLAGIEDAAREIERDTGGSAIGAYFASLVRGLAI